MPRRRIWERDERVIVYLADRRSRYPSIAKTGHGRQLVLFTHQSEEQERSGGGDLMCMRCSADGKWWLDKQVIHESKDSEPRAYGTMTALGSVQILAPFTEVNDQFATSQVRIAVLQGDGETFEVGSPIAMEPLCWAAPSGRLFERDGTLVMPVFGALSKHDLKQTRHTCGLFRSTDVGKTWGDWSVIAPLAYL